MTAADAQPRGTRAPAKTAVAANGTSYPSPILHRSLHRDPMQVVSGKGNYLTFENGQKFLDATCGAAVACLGHAHPGVADAVSTQMQTLSYALTLIFSTPITEELGQFLIDSTHGQMSKCFLVSSGSEAMEGALKLARQYFLESPSPQPRRVNFISRHHSYHGTTLGSLAVGGHVGRRKHFEPILAQNFGKVSPCNAYRGKSDDESNEAYVVRLADELEREFQRLGPHTVCAFVAEVVVGAALGCVPSVKGYFKAMKAVCDKHGALLILDEVMSGMGRTGTLHAWEQEEIVPDIQTIGKGLGGGFAPVAGMLINKRVVEAFHQGSGAFIHGQTYQGHPVACAAALKVQQVIKEERLLDNIKAMGNLLQRLLVEKLAEHPNVGNIRGRGLFWGIEFVRDKRKKQPFEAGLGVANGINALALQPEYSISLYPGQGTCDGVQGDHILLAPAYNVTSEDIERIAALTTSVITDYFQTLDKPSHQTNGSSK